MIPSRRTRAAVLLVLSLAFLPSAAQTQKTAPDRPAPACGVERALQLIRQQASEAKAFANGAKRVAVLARVADLLWPFDEAQAREVFAGAFEVASSHYREHGPEFTVRKASRGDARLPGITYGLLDPRLTVIRALARHDPVWARKLSERAADETRERASAVGAKSGREGSAADRLIMMARSLQSSDLGLAVSVARASLRYPASRSLSDFIYDAARSDRAAADEVYVDALRAYTDAADLTSLLQLSGYPFGLSQNLGLRHGYNAAGVPPRDFAPSADWQRRFVGAFLRVAGRKLEAAAGQPPPMADSYQQPPSDAELIYGTLVSLENIYGPSDRNFAALAAPLKQMAGGTLSGNGLRRAEDGARRAPETEPPPPDPSSVLDNVLANAERFKDMDAHDRMIVTGLFSRFGSESMERLEAAADKLKDAEVRRQFLEAANFDKSLKASREGRPDEAARFAEKVGSLEQRAALACELAEAELKQSGAGSLALAVADAAYKSAQGAPESDEKARALVALTRVYWRLDPSRVAAVLAEAVAAVNRVPDMDSMRPFITRAIDGRKFNFYSSYPSPVFNLEAVLRDVSEGDFDAAFAAAGGLDDKHLRALAVIALASKCLADAPKPERREKQEKPKKPTRGGRRQ